MGSAKDASRKQRKSKGSKDSVTNELLLDISEQSAEVVDLLLGSSKTPLIFNSLVSPKFPQKSSKKKSNEQNVRRKEVIGNTKPNSFNKKVSLKKVFKDFDFGVDLGSDLESSTSEEIESEKEQKTFAKKSRKKHSKKNANSIEDEIPREQFSLDFKNGDDHFNQVNALKKTDKKGKPKRNNTAKDTGNAESAKCKENCKEEDKNVSHGSHNEGKGNKVHSKQKKKNKDKSDKENKEVFSKKSKAESKVKESSANAKGSEAKKERSGSEVKIQKGKSNIAKNEIIAKSSSEALF